MKTINELESEKEATHAARVAADHYAADRAAALGWLRVFRRQAHVSRELLGLRLGLLNTGRKRVWQSRALGSIPA